MRPDEVHVSAQPAAPAAERIQQAALDGKHVVLSGGSTPRRAYELAAALGGDWSRATLWFGDERAVPPDHKDSNYGMAKAALLDRLDGPAPHVYRMKGELGPQEGASDYERAMRDAFDGGEPPAFDLVLMGLGPDAHTCSLFPGNPELGERERWAAGVETPGMPPLVPRITMTFPVLNRSRDMLFLVAGEDKVDAVHRAFVSPPDPSAPSSLVEPEGKLELFIDEAAAAGLEES